MYLRCLTEVSGSSIQNQDSANYGPLLAIDGLMETFFASELKDNEINSYGIIDGLSYWRIDLKARYYIAGVHLFALNTG